MATCTSCGYDVTGKKFCQQCGTPVQPTVIPTPNNQTMPSSNTCPRCNETVNPGSAFCNHCGSSLSPQVLTATPAPSQPLTRHCPACQAEVPANNAFCSSCGQNLQTPVVTPASAFCTNCGQKNAPGVRFCASCGSPLGAPAVATQANYTPSPGQYPPQQPYTATYGQPQYAPQPNAQPPYPQQPQYAQQYQQGQMPGYQPQPMMGQQPMALHCPVCMAMAPMGSTNCVSCHTSLSGVVPTPANVPAQGQQGGLGGFMQGDGGKYAIGALGGAAALMGGEMLLHGLEGGRNDGYYGEEHHRNEGLLGGLGEIANDIGL
jgi:rRNA maturation endonuclease Nob1